MSWWGKERRRRLRRAAAGRSRCVARHLHTRTERSRPFLPLSFLFKTKQATHDERRSASTAAEEAAARRRGGGRRVGSVASPFFQCRHSRRRARGRGGAVRVCTYCARALASREVEGGPIQLSIRSPGQQPFNTKKTKKQTGAAAAAAPPSCAASARRCRRGARATRCCARSRPRAGAHSSSWARRARARRRRSRSFWTRPGTRARPSKR